MARLIDADAALKAVCYNCMDKYDCPDRCSDYMEVFEIPTVDAVEVVRCKDCTNAEYFNGVLCCSMAHDVVRQKNDFCSYGEKRGDSQ